MSYENVFKRYEVKFLISDDQKKALYQKMKDYMKPDEFGKSTICNLYFDTPDKLLIRRSLDKPCYKEKLRVRSYGLAKAESPVFIELKKKYQGIVYKRRIHLDEKTARNYLVNHIPLLKQNQISKEIDYLMALYGNIEPAVFLSYRREAFFDQSDQNFRMTFDENVLMRDYDLSLNSGVYGQPLLANDTLILEVKTVFGLPKWLRDFLSDHKIYKTSYSKYGNAYTNQILPKLLGEKRLPKDKRMNRSHVLAGEKNVA